MARRKNSDSQATSAAIVQAAQAVLQRDGPRSVSFRRVADECSMSVGTVSYYFPDRAALLEACLAPHAEHLNQLMAELLSKVQTSGLNADVIITMLDAAVEMAFREQTFVRLRALTNAEIRALDPDRLPDLSLPFLNQLGRLLGKHLAMDPTDARMVLQTLNYAIGRYAELADEELCRITAADTVEEARKRVRKHLRSSALKLLSASST